MPGTGDKVPPVSEVAGRAVLITGAGGFIGGHLAAALVRDGAEVRAFVRYNSRGELGTLSWFEPAFADELDVVLGDLRDLESVMKASEGIDVIFHLGAQIAIPYSYLNPRDFFETNVLGSLNVAQAALKHDVGRVVQVSSSEVYGTAQQIPITESHPLEPQSPYAASKVGADKLMDSYHRTHELPVTVVRPFNTYGPHQSARAIVPTIVAQALGSDMLELGSLEPRRDLTFVSDTVAGIIAGAGPASAIGKTVQLGTGEDVSIGELVGLVAEILGKQLDVRHDPRRVRPPQGEVQRLTSDPGLADRLLSWQPKVGLHDGLAQTIEWIAAHPHHYRPSEYAI